MTNPPVPATPLDVEACAGMLTELTANAAFYHLHPRTVALLSALASALPGMGKALAIADEWFGCCDCITTEFGTDERKKQYWALRRAARAAQPEETSADGR